VNVCVHAAEHSLEELERELLPQLRETAAAIEDDLAARRRIPHVVVS
jgi:hypothetical protein